MALLSVGDLKVAYEQDGGGPDVVLIHGGFADRSMWKDTAQRLARHFRVTTYDMRGHGETGPSGYAVYSAELYARDLAQLMTALDIDRAHIVGISFGGVVAQNLALVAPERIDRLVLASTMVRHDLTRTDRIITYFPFISPSVTLRAIGPIPTARLSLGLIRLWRGHGWMSVNAETRAYLLSMAKAMSRAEYVKVLRCVYRNAGVDLAEIAAPTLVLTGEMETDVLKRHAEVLRDGIPNAQHCEIAEAGHIINLDQPEAFAEAVLEFLNEGG